MDRITVMVACVLLISCGQSGSTTKEQKSTPGAKDEIAQTSSPLKTTVDVAINVRYCTYEDTLGVGGYDLISFFESGNPKKGISKFTAAHDGLTYLFSNEVNRDKFSNNPELYIPQYGGWCATNLADGILTVPKYELYLVEEGKLYLFERTLSLNGKQVWLNAKKENERKASENYNYLITHGKFPS